MGERAREGVRRARRRFERIAFLSARRPEEPLWIAAFPGAIRATGGSGCDALTGAGISGDGYRAVMYPQNTWKEEADPEVPGSLSRVP